MWDVAARRPWTVTAVCLVLTTLAAFGALRIETQVDFVDAVPEHKGLAPYRTLLGELDGVRFVAIYMAHDPSHPSSDLRSEDGFDALVYQQQALRGFLDQRFPGAIDHELSAYEAMRAGHYMFFKIATAGNPPDSAYGLPDETTWPAVRDQVLSGDGIDDVLASDGSSALALYFLSTDDNLEARRLAGDMGDAVAGWNRADTVTTDHQATGLLYASDYTDDRNARDIPFWGTIAAGAAAAVLLAFLRRPSHVLLAVTGVAVATVWTFGVIGWSGLRLSFLSLFLAPVVAGIGIDHSIHVLYRYQEEQGHQRHRMASALRTSGKAAALAAATTVAGLSAMLFVPARLFSEIGGLAALGIGLGLVAALTLVPALRVLIPDGHGLHPPAARGLPRFGKPALAGLIVVTIVAAVVAATMTRVESGSSENEFPQDDPVIRLQHRIEEEYGAFQRAYLIVQGDLTEPVALRAMHAAVQDAAGLPLYRDASSVVDLLLADEATDEGAKDVALGAILTGAGAEPDDEDRLPQTRGEAKERLDRLFADPLWKTIAPFTITRDYDLAVVAITVDPWHDQQELKHLDAALQRAARALADQLPDHEVAAAGSPTNRAAVIEQTPWDVAIATIGAATAAGIVLAIAWARKPGGLKVAAAGVAIVLAAAIWLLATIPLLDGIYAVTGTSNNAALTDMFLLAFAITVAVGIDDLVHIASRYWHAAAAGHPDPLREAYRHAGIAVLATTATTFTAFGVLAGIYFLQSKNLAILTAAGALYALVLTLALAPVVLRPRASPTPSP